MRRTRRRRHRRSKHRRKTGGIRSNLSNENAANLRAVLAYERNPSRNRRVAQNTMTIRERIESLLLKQPPLTNEMVVWRGQSHNVIEPTSWFSTSHRDEVARSYGGSYLFKIHLQPGIHALDMYKYYAAANITNPYSEPNTIRAFLENNALIMSNNYIAFEEVIVQGGGQFWKDAAHTEKGFREIGAMRPTMWDFAEVDDPEWPDMIVYESYYSV